MASAAIVRPVHQMSAFAKALQDPFQASGRLMRACAPQTHRFLPGSLIRDRGMRRTAPHIR